MHRHLNFESKKEQKNEGVMLSKGASSPWNLRSEETIQHERNLYSFLLYFFYYFHYSFCSRVFPVQSILIKKKKRKAQFQGSLFSQVELSEWKTCKKSKMLLANWLCSNLQANCFCRFQQIFSTFKEMGSANFHVQNFNERWNKCNFIIVPQN